MSGEDEWFWIDNAAEPTLGVQIGGVVLVNVHPREKCAGETCVIHNPSEHHMRSWPTNWRGDRGLMERTCPHGVGHPDPDSLASQKRIGNGWQAVHGCDGCCAKPAAHPDPEEPAMPEHESATEGGA